MDDSEAFELALSMLREKKRITNSQLRLQFGGDEALLQRIREDLILQDFAEDYKNVGLILIDSKSSYDQDISEITPQVSIENTDSLSGNHENTRIFISYGRKGRGLALAERLERDLLCRGYDVYRDLHPYRGLKGGHDWEWELEKQIGARTVFLSLLTCYAVRRPDGYCLDEISLARSLQKKIIPLLVESAENNRPCRPPLCIHRLNFIDYQQWEKEYDKKFTELLRAIHAPQQYDGLSIILLSFGGDPQSIEYDFTGEMSRKAKNFTGREWLTGKVNSWLHSSNDQILLLTGDPGSGKSAFIAHLALTHPEGKAAHFFIRSWDATRRPGPFLCSLALMIASQIPKYQQAIKPLLNTPGFLLKSSGDLLWDLIINPLEKIGIDNHEPVFIMLDAIDESIEYNQSEIVTLLIEGIQERRIPSWIRFLISSRSVPLVTTAFRGFPTWDISHTKPEANIEDIREYLENNLGNSLFQDTFKDYEIEKEREKLIESLINSSEGNFLYLWLVLEDIRKGLIDPTKPEYFPSGLPEYYTRNFERLYPDIDKYCLKSRRVLDIIFAAREPLTKEEIADILRKTPSSIDRILEPVLPFLEREGDPKNPKYRSFHTSFTDWITGEKPDPRDSVRYQVDLIVGHQNIASYLYKQYKSGILSRLILEYLPYHLFHAKRFNDLIKILTNFNFINEKILKFGPYKILKDFELILDKKLKMNISDGDQKAIQLIYEALRLSSHVLSKNPDELRSQMTGRLLVFDDFNIRNFLSQIISFNREVWICPIIPSLVSPSGSLIRILEGHSDRVIGLALTPKSDWIISGSTDKTIKIWELATGECIHTLRGHKGSVTSVAVSPDGKLVISGSEDETIRIWDTITGECLHTLRGHKGPVTSVAVCHIGNFIISGSEDETIRIWDVATRKCICFLEGHCDAVTSVVILSKDPKIISSSKDRKIKIWNFESFESITKPRILRNRTLRGHKDTINTIAISGYEQNIISGSNDRTIRVWEIDSGKCVKNIPGHGKITALTICPARNLFVTGSEDKTIRIWNLETGDFIYSFEGHFNAITSLLITPDGRQLLSSSNDGSIQVWDLECKNKVQSSDRSPCAVKIIVPSKYGDIAISGSEDGTIRFWNLTNGNCIRIIQAGKINGIESIAITPTGNHFVTTSNDQVIRIWDLISGKIIRKFTERTNWITNIVITPDGGNVVSGSGFGPIRVWDFKSGECIRIMNGHDEAITSIAISPDGCHVISGSIDKTIRVWDLESGDCVRIMNGHDEAVTSIAITPDGCQVISGSKDKTIRVWDLESGDCIRNLPQNFSDVIALGISSDGQLLVSGSSEKILKIWSLHDGKLLSSFSCEGIVKTCVFSNNNRIIAGDQFGWIHFMSLENWKSTSPILTAWHFSNDSTYAIGCSYCRSWSVISESSIGHEINCLSCGKKLKINPFTIDGDWRAIENAGKH